MSIALAEALTSAGKKDLDTLMEAVRDEFVRWRHSPENGSWQKCFDLFYRLAFRYR